VIIQVLHAVFVETEVFVSNSGSGTASPEHVEVGFYFFQAKSKCCFIKARENCLFFGLAWWMQ